MRILSHWAISSLSIGIAAYVVPDVSITFEGALIAAIVLGALNLFIRPVIALVLLPITILTLGLFSLVINAFLVMLASYLVPGFFVAGFWPAFLFAIALTVVHWVFHFWHRP